MDKLKTVDVGGFPLLLNDLRQFFGRLDAPSEGIYQAFNNLLRGFGDNFIVQGCVASGIPAATTITEGWILLSGELIKVDAQGPFDSTVDGTFVKSTTFNSRGTKTFLNGSVNETYETNRGVISGLAGTLAFDADTFSELRTIASVSSTDTPILTKIVDIGDWNMDVTASVFVSHGITDFKKIRKVSVIIRDDTDASLTDLGFVSSGATIVQGWVITSTDFILSRESGGVYDNTTFDSLGFNRGFITIDFVK